MILKVNSLPLSEVMQSLAKGFEAELKIKCKEYYFNIPVAYGRGQVRAVTFDNGMGIILYDFILQSSLEIQFTVDDIHPIKYLYAVEGPVEHKFANEKIINQIDKYKCAIVASEKNNGHVLRFKSDEHIHIISLEIDRDKFLTGNSCEIDFLNAKLKKLFRDTEANYKFYHNEYYGLHFRDILTSMREFEDRHLIRYFHLESTALAIFVNHLDLFNDDQLEDGKKNILRANELGRIELLVEYLKDNLNEDLTIEFLTNKSGLNASKLQTGFKSLYGTTVIDYIINLRIIEAAKQLLISDETINMIASSVGFENGSYFSKRFKEKYGISPKKYRKLRK